MAGVVVAVLFKEIDYFIAVAECLSFSSAAERLFVSQPGLSKLISKMEDDLGFTLFKRTTRKVALTDEGRRFYEFSKTYLAQCRALIPCTSLISGNLAIGFGNIVEQRQIPDAISSFKWKYPNVSISIKYYNSEILIKSLTDNELDLGVISSYSIHNHDFKWKIMFPRKLRIVVWRNHPLTKKRIVRPEDLVDEPFVFVSSSVSKGINRLFELCEKAGFTPRVVQETNDFRVLYVLVAQKLGICFNLALPNPDVEDFPGLQSIDLDLTDYPEFSVNQGIALVWSAKNANPAISLFTEHF